MVGGAYGVAFYTRRAGFARKLRRRRQSAAAKNVRRVAGFCAFSTDFD